MQGKGNVDTTKNTGNIAKQTRSFNGITHPLVQSYKYDALGRLLRVRPPEQERNQNLDLSDSFYIS
ncbi:MAG: hypothetical protein JNL64_02875 [Blastocatellia bacterium]|nr:hypothetical protein [Blastocatellia bacterium]